ncbi:MAG: type II secretion system protein GspM [Patulibacter minatonensis]
MTRRDRLVLLAVLGVGVLIGFYMFVISPQQKAASDAKAQVQTARQQLDSARARVDSGQKAQAQYRRDRASIVKIGRVVPETDDIPTLLTQLETIGKKYHVYFIKYSIGSSTGGGSSSPSASSAPAATTPSAPSSSSSTVGGGGKGTEVNGSTDATAPLYPPGSVEMTGGLGRTPISLGLKGTYFNLERYLRAVQRFAVLSQSGQSRTNGRLMVVDGFSYKTGDLVFWYGSKGESRKTDRFLVAELGASVYFAPPLEAPVASSAAPGGAVAPAATPATSTGTAAVGGLR